MIIENHTLKISHSYQKKGYRDFDESCEADFQCNKSANVEQQQQLNNQTVYLFSFITGNLSLGQPCIHEIQCMGTKNAGRCLNAKCLCNEGFALEKLRCLPGKQIEI